MEVYIVGEVRRQDSYFVVEGWGLLLTGQGPQG